MWIISEDQQIDYAASYSELIEVRELAFLLMRIFIHNLPPCTTDKHCPDLCFDKVILNERSDTLIEGKATAFALSVLLERLA